MTDILVSEDMVPLGEFKAQASRLLARLAVDRHTLVITQNGRPAGGAAHRAPHRQDGATRG